MPPIFRTKSFRLGALGALLIGVYAIAGFVAAPKILRSELIENLQKSLGLTPVVGEIRFNPFLLQLEIKDFSLPDAGGKKMVGFGRLFVEFRIASLWHRALMFRDIEIGDPYLFAAVARDGGLNLLALRSKAPPPAAAQPGPQQPLPAVRIGSFSVTHGLVTYDDLSRETPFSTRLEPIDFSLQDFTTGADGGRFSFSGSTKLGERIEWRGHVAVKPVESDGELRIEKLRAQTVWSYVEDRVAFAVDSGSIDVAAQYRFSLTDAVNLSVEGLEVTLADLAIRPKGGSSAWIVVPSLTVHGGTADLAKHAAHVDSVLLSGLTVDAWREADGALNLAQLAGGPAPPAASPATAPAAAPTAPVAVAPSPAAAAVPWRFDLGEFAIRDARLTAVDRGTTPAAKLELAPFSLRLTGLSSDLAKSVGLTLETRINGSGALAVSGTAAPQPASADLAVKFGGVELPALQPYLDKFTSMTLDSGRLAGHAEVRYGAKPRLAVDGDVSIEQLHTVDNALHDDFVSFGRLDVLGLKYQQDPDRLDVQRIVVKKPYARVIIESDASLNVKRVLAGPAGATHAIAAASVPPPAAAKPRRAQAAAQMTARTPVASGPSPASMPMSIQRIVFETGKANFSDLSVMPNFSAAIQKLNGSVRGLSTQTGARASIDLHGEVGPFAPVSITGKVGLGGVLYTDLAISFHNIELSIFNPYSGKFAGYDIAKGKLTTDLHYKVVGRALDATHHVVIDQLEFGDKTASKDAVSLPVKLAVSLLKDRNGVIAIDLPVQGSLDDPTFRLGPVIWKIVLNLLEKAVTAPFALLGSLFGAGPDLQFIDFQPGDAALGDAAAGKITTVAKAMVERPQLKLEVPIAVLPDIDRPALVAAKYRASLQDLGREAAGRKSNEATAGTDFQQLPAKTQLRLLTGFYRKEFGGAPQFPEPVAGSQGGADAVTAARIEYLTSTLRARVVISDAELQALAERRATVLQKALLASGGVDPARVFLVVNGKAKTQDGAVRLELSLQ